MRLLRVQVPEFRALKDVDISFEPEFVPQVFPLGSLNGGGKSTLLQLIFVLLHCSAHKEKHHFIASMLDGIIIPEGETNRLLAKFELSDGEEKFELEFTVYNDRYLQQLDIDPIFDKEKVSFDILLRESQLISDHKRLKESIRLSQYSDIYDGDELMVTSQDLKEDDISRVNEIEKTLQTIKPLIKNITEIIEIKNHIYITTLPNKSMGFICHISNITGSLEDAKKKLNYISDKVFLSAPSNQIYLFLNKNFKRALFSKDNNYDNYLNAAKRQLQNFKTYDVFSTDLIVTLFENSRNKDFKILVETGEHGDNYKAFVKELGLFTDKKVVPQLGENSKITGVIFKSNNGVELYPEDLSHGELKRLSIYAWLKSMLQGENIVLMDEIENGFHLDWQYTIVRDLVEWGKNNQYILATHSYELCTAVTPAHVKELEPKLIAK